MPIRWALGLYEFCASLKLAVTLIFTAAIVLGWATFVESRYGTPAVQFGIYGTWWFTLINVLLFINIFSAASIRYPWKRHQTGFVVTHIGLLTLLIGCGFSRLNGIDAQLPVFEDAAAHTVLETEQEFQIEIVDKTAAQPAQPTVLKRDFRAGPFNWTKYTAAVDAEWDEPNASIGIDGEPIERSLPAIPWRLATRDQGEIYDGDGLKLSVLDYYSNCREVVLPAVRIRLSMPRSETVDLQGRTVRTAYRFVPVELEMRDRWPSVGKRAFGRRQTMGGGSFSIGMTPYEGELQHFLDSAPQDDVSNFGQVVMHLGGQKVYFDPGTHQNAAEPVKLGETGWQARDVELDMVFPRVRFKLDDPQGKSSDVVLYADAYELNQQPTQPAAFGSFWISRKDLPQKQVMAGGRRQRIDVLQGPDLKLYYRYYNGMGVPAAGELPDSQPTAVDAFAMPRDTLKMYVDRHLPAEAPFRAVYPEPFDNTVRTGLAPRAVKLQAEYAGQKEEFWLLGDTPLLFDANVDGLDDFNAGRMMSMTPPMQHLLMHRWLGGSGIFQVVPSPLEVRKFDVGDKAYTLRLSLKQFDLGFDLKLLDFTRRLDPGTQQPADYYSDIMLMKRESEGEPLFDDELRIGMNAPIDVTDPKDGRSYRLFQESFRTFNPGDPTYTSFYRQNPRLNPRDQLALSYFAVNYDSPGRALKYLGSALIVFGIGIMFYMRAYFFAPRRKATAEKAEPERSSPPAAKVKPRPEKVLQR